MCEMMDKDMAQLCEITLRDSVPQGDLVLSSFGRQTDLLFCEKPVFTTLSESCNHSHSTKTKQFCLCDFAFRQSLCFDFTMYLYYPLQKCPCYHFVIEVDNKNNFTVDNMETVR